MRALIGRVPPFLDASNLCPLSPKRDDLLFFQIPFRCSTRIPLFFWAISAARELSPHPSTIG